jgi:hypothetical protein
MTAHFDAIHSFASIDFTLLRIYSDRSGLFIALDPDQPVDPVVEAVEDAVG